MEVFTPVLLGYVLQQTGERKRAEKIFNEFVRYATAEIEGGNQYNVLRYVLAEIAAVHGRTEEALDWLDRAIESGWYAVWGTIRDPLLASIRNEGRFHALVDRMREHNEKLRRRIIQSER